MLPDADLLKLLIPQILGQEVSFSVRAIYSSEMEQLVARGIAFACDETVYTKYVTRRGVKQTFAPFADVAEPLAGTMLRLALIAAGA